MRYRAFGRAGFAVSEISLGTVELGLEYGIAAPGEVRRPAEADAARLLNHALDAGINLIDTARAYGESEGVIGRAISHRRSEFYICTKVQALPERMEASIEESLSQLKTDCVDLLLLHSSRATDLDDARVNGILERAKQRGQARYIGASVYGPAAARQAIQSGRYDALQVAWSPLDRRIEPEILDLARANGIGIMVRSVLMRGALTHRAALLPDVLAPVREGAEKLEQNARSVGLTLPELAYRYVLSHAGPWTALVGTGHTAELDLACGYAARGGLDPSLMAAVAAVQIGDETLLDISRWPPS